MYQRGVVTIPPSELSRRRRLRWIVAVLVVLVVMTLAATFLPRTALLPVALRQPNPHPFLEARTREARWQQDLRYLARELPRLHVDAFHMVSRSVFQRQVEALRQDIPMLSDDEIVLRLMALVASIGDGHTTLNYTALYHADAAQAEARGWWLFPLSMAWMEGDWYVVGAGDGFTHLLGAQVVTIDDVPVDGVYARVGAEVAADNEMQRRAGAAPLLVTADVLYALGITAQPQHANFHFVLPGGQEVDVALDAVAADTVQLQGIHLPAQEIPLAMQNPELWYWFTTLPEQGALYFQYDVCDEMADYPFGEFVNELFEAVDNQELTRVVVDLRNNSGGNSAVLRPFLAALAARPTLDVYVLIGRRTFSSALMNAIELDQQADAVLVGEETGGRPNHYGEVRSFYLPNSQLRVSYSTKYFRMLPDADPVALAPEIATPVTIANQLAGHDAALTAALTVATAMMPNASTTE